MKKTAKQTMMHRLIAVMSAICLLAVGLFLYHVSPLKAEDQKNNVVTMDMKDIPIGVTSKVDYDPEMLNHWTNDPSDANIPGGSYLTNEMVGAASSIAISNSGGPAIMEPWVMIQLPKSKLVARPSMGGSIDAYDSFLLEDDENYYQIYKFHRLAGGYAGSYRFQFQFDPRKTQNGDIIRSTTKILDASGVSNPESVKDLQTIL